MAKGVNNTGLASEVRRIAKTLGTFTYDDIRHSDLAAMYADLQKIRLTFRDFIRRGEIRRLNQGQYEYVSGIYGKTWEVKNRIYRAMRIKGSFSAREIKVLSEGSILYIREVIKKLVKSGYLEEMGTRLIPKGGIEKVFRVRNSDRFYREIVKN